MMGCGRSILETGRVAVYLLRQPHRVKLPPPALLRVEPRGEALKLPPRVPRQHDASSPEACACESASATRFSRAARARVSSWSCAWDERSSSRVARRESRSLASWAATDSLRSSELDARFSSAAQRVDSSSSWASSDAARLAADSASRLEDDARSVSSRTLSCDAASAAAAASWCEACAARSDSAAWTSRASRAALRSFDRANCASALSRAVDASRICARAARSAVTSCSS